MLPLKLGGILQRTHPAGPSNPIKPIKGMDTGSTYLYLYMIVYVCIGYVYIVYVYIVYVYIVYIVYVQIVYACVHMYIV